MKKDVEMVQGEQVIEVVEAEEVAKSTEAKAAPKKPSLIKRGLTMIGKGAKTVCRVAKKSEIVKTAAVGLVGGVATVGGLVLGAKIFGGKTSDQVEGPIDTACEEVTEGEVEE